MLENTVREQLALASIRLNWDCNKTEVLPPFVKGKAVLGITHVTSWNKQYGLVFTAMAYKRSYSKPVFFV